MESTIILTQLPPQTSSRWQCHLPLLWCGICGSFRSDNAGELLAISIAMQVRQYNVGHIAQWSTSRAILEATGDEKRLTVGSDNY